LLAASIVSLLASRSEFDVTNSTFASLAIMDEPNSPQPDIVILEKAHLMANMSAVVKLADRHPNLRLIIFGLSDNTLQVFDKQMVEVRQVSDFLELQRSSRIHDPALDPLGEESGGETYMELKCQRYKNHIEIIIGGGS